MEAAPHQNCLRLSSCISFISKYNNKQTTLVVIGVYRIQWPGWLGLDSIKKGWLALASNNKIDFSLYDFRGSQFFNWKINRTQSNDWNSIIERFEFDYRTIWIRLSNDWNSIIKRNRMIIKFLHFFLDWFDCLISFWLPFD